MLNGYGKKIDDIHRDVEEIKDHLADSVGELSSSVRDLTSSIDKLSIKQEQIYGHALQSIPLRFVFYFFFLLMLAFDRAQLARALIDAVVQIKGIFLGGS